jgi:protein gp37
VNVENAKGTAVVDRSKIAWTDATWNFVVGCSKVSPGCQNCYAERLALRYGWNKSAWTAPNARENVIIKTHKLTLPFKWKEPRRIFVNSLSDLFHELVPDDVIDRAFAVMAACPQHTFQILTKRPKRMLEYFAHLDPRIILPLRNIWLGVSVEDQRRADERIPLLLQTPAAVRFLSCEPLLGEIQLDKFNGQIHWVICGGESGPHFRTMNLDWARHLRDVCLQTGIPFFYKQGSAFHAGQDALLDGVEWNQYPEVKGGENNVTAIAQNA